MKRNSPGRSNRPANTNIRRQPPINPTRSGNHHGSLWRHSGHHRQHRAKFMSGGVKTKTSTTACSASFESADCADCTDGCFPPRHRNLRKASVRRGDAKSIPVFPAPWRLFRCAALRIRCASGIVASCEKPASVSSVWSSSATRKVTTWQVCRSCRVATHRRARWTSSWSASARPNGCGSVCGRNHWSGIAEQNSERRRD